MVYKFDPEKYAGASEDSHQIALFGWTALPEIKTKYPELKWLFAVPNGGFRNKATAGKLKASGLKKGVPDICLPIKRGIYSGLWIELKVKKNKPTPEQLEWISLLQSQGFGACVCVGFQEARDMLIKYLEFKNV